MNSNQPGVVELVPLPFDRVPAVRRVVPGCEDADVVAYSKQVVIGWPVSSGRGVLWQV